MLGRASALGAALFVILAGCRAGDAPPSADPAQNPNGPDGRPHDPNETVDPSASPDPPAMMQVRRVPGAQVEVRAFPVEEDRVRLIVKTQPSGASGWKWSWREAERDGQLRKEGAIEYAAGRSLSAIAVRSDFDFLDASVVDGDPVAARIVQFPIASGGPVRPHGGFALPFTVADGLRDLGAGAAAYHARCVSDSPLFVYSKLGSEHYVRATQLANGDFIVISSSCGFAKWQRIASDGHVSGESFFAKLDEISGAPLGVMFESLVAAVDVGADGSSTVVLDVQAGWDWPGVLTALGLRIEPARDKNFVVIHAGPDGEIRWRQALTFDGRRSISHVAQAEGVIRIAGGVSHRVTRPSDSWDEDVWLASLDGSTGARLGERVIDVDAEDWVDAIATDPRGGLVVALRAGAVQVDTGSVVSFPDIVLLSLDASFAERERLRFGSARSDAVEKIVVRDSRIVISGRWDGPITHTPEAEWDFGGFWASLPLEGWPKAMPEPRTW